jgi:tRNA A-37 threonylcarbamoyl transferase component Bud32
MVECPKGKIMNPNTGRCVKKDGKIGKELLKSKSKRSKKVSKSRRKSNIKVCPNGTIMNPKTGRCVKKDGKIGQELLKSRRKSNIKVSKSRRKSNIKVSKSRRKSNIKVCPNGTIMNPMTGRCIKKDGKIGKKILLKYGEVVTALVLNEYGNKYGIIEDCMENEKVWKEKELIGKGKYGKAYIACKKGNCNYVLKIQQISNEFYEEVYCLKDTQDLNVVPKLYNAWTCGDLGYMAMEKMEKCSKEEFNKNDKRIYIKIKKVLEKFKSKGWLHIDIHKGNIMCKNGKFVLIDFGWAVKKGKKTYPNHPISLNFGGNLPLTYKDLELTQEMNTVRSFSNDNKKFDELKKKWNEMIKKRKEERI